MFSMADLIGQEIHLDSIETLIHQVMKDFELPGLAIGIVQKDSPTYLKGFGTREIDKDFPVDENTIFGIGSISKSFTALTLGILVDQGKITWDDRVTEYLPDFKLYDPYVTDNFTIRDLLTHRSGLKAISTGTLFYHSNLSRTEIIEKLRYLKPVGDYRTVPAYQNVMYMVAGEIVRVVSGTSWDEFLQTNVFDKLNMSKSVSVSNVREMKSNLAKPHILNDDFKRIAIAQEKGDNLAGAGFIYSSVEDMSKYMKFLLNKGVFQHDNIVGAKIITELFKPQIHFPIYKYPIHNEFTSYGLGWWLTPKDGHKIIEHSGGIDGMSANLIMIEDMGFGIIVVANASEAASTLLTFRVLGSVLGDESYDFYEYLVERRNSKIKRKKQSLIQLKNARVKGTGPSVDLTSFVGVYENELYGQISINSFNDKELEIKFAHTPIFTGRLKHWHYDTFQIDWYDARIPNGFLTFTIDSKREVVEMKIEQENLLDVDFSELGIIRKIR